MAIGPIDYYSQYAPNLGGSFIQGLSAGAQMRQAQASNAQEAERKRIQDLIRQATTDKSMSVDQVRGAAAEAATLSPVAGQILNERAKLMEAGAERSYVTRLATVKNALIQGKPQAAYDYLQNEILAAENSKNTELANELRQIQSGIYDQAEYDSSNEEFKRTGIRPSMQAKDYTPLVQQLDQSMIFSPYGQEYLKENNKAAIEFRKMQIEEEKLRQGQAKSEAQLRELEARRLKSIMGAKKLGAEIYGLERDLAKAAAGDQTITDPVKRFEFEDKLRNEYVTRTKDYTEMTRQMQNITASAADTTGASDIALVTSFMKMLDPGSVVRETEFATARDTAGLYDQLGNRLQKLQQGSFLSPEQRKAYVELSKKYMDASNKHESNVRDHLGRSADTYGLNKENIFPGQSSSSPSAPREVDY